MEEVEQKDKPVLYGPTTGKHLKKMYPELAVEPLFKEVKNDELLFAWYLGCKSSPIDPEWADEIKYKQAAINAFPNDPEKRAQYSAKNIPEQVRLAVEKMSTYSPKARELAARTLQNHFHNLLEMSQVDVKKDFQYVDKEGNELIDWTARNQYVSSVKTSTEILPNLIKQIEEGFGIEKSKKEESGTRAIEKYHNDKKNQSS
jgi:hypothetical protein